MRSTHAGLFVALIAFPAAAQVPDSAVHIPDLSVTVTRAPAQLNSLGASVSVVDSTTLNRNRLTSQLDDALAFVPGVIAQNRWNYSLDQRLIIRGFGARANFGVRGIKLLLDGVPQTLPDGQSQLNNVDFSLLQRIEVLRGGASALYGNASGGVVSMTTLPIPVDPFAVTLSGEAGALGTDKEEAAVSARSGSLGGTVAASRFSTDGFRQQSGAEQRRLNAAFDWMPNDQTTWTLRFNSADDPHARNPGALTAAELAINPDSAAAANIRRGADKAVTQTQLALGLRRRTDRWQLDVTAYGLTRSLENPLATPPPAPASFTEGTYVGIDRLLGGVRSSATLMLPHAQITAGIDAQQLRDNRTNRRSVNGQPTDTLLLDQQERVSERAAFAQISWSPIAQVTLRAGGRRDANTFGVTDHFLSDGDASATRTMNANSGNAGISWNAWRGWTVWTDIATVFETPTTTELANRPDGSGGFNPDLNPQRSVTEEIGARKHQSLWQIDAAAYHTITSDAIVPYSEVAGRSYFTNAGKTRTQGAELAVEFNLTHAVALQGAWTHTDAKFVQYLVVSPASTDTLNGHQLAGIPRYVTHLGAAIALGMGITLDLDQAWSSAMFGDDDNHLKADGWTATSARLAWVHRTKHWDWAPYLNAVNLFDHHYVGSVTVNGAGGRVFEPAPGRIVFVGARVTAR